MVLVIPYSYSWTSSDYKIATMIQAKSMGVNALKFAFVIASGKHVASDIDDQLSDLNLFTKAGGKLVISFGGQDGTMIDEAITDVGQLYQAYVTIINKTGSRAFDFDIEGKNVGKTSVHQRRNIVLNKLLAVYPDLYVSYTLTADTSGLGSDVLKIVQMAVASKCRVNVVNVMLMDNEWTNTATSSIISAEALKSQLQVLWPQLTLQQIYGKIGMTMMIGKNDDSSICTISHAHQIAMYAHNNNIAELSYWALQRDVVGPKDYNYASLVNINDLDFYHTFSGGSSMRSIHAPVIPPRPIVPWINKVYLGKTILQDKLPNWCKANGLQMGDQPTYKYITVSNPDITELLTKYNDDKNAQVINYNWSTGVAYITKGTNPSVAGDTCLKPGCTAYIKLY